MQRVKEELGRGGHCALLCVPVQDRLCEESRRKRSMKWRGGKALAGRMCNQQLGVLIHVSSLVQCTEARTEESIF